jgi:RecA-family ATPase
LKALTLGELLEWKAPYQKYIIQDILMPKTKMIMFGRFQSWKSMIAMHTGFIVSRGEKWFNIPTSASPVYYLQIEMPQAQLQKRVSKYVIGNNIPASVNGVHFATEHYIKLDKGFGVAAIEAELGRTHPGVLIVDPVYRVVSGHITDEYDMRLFMDRMDLLIDKYNLALILVHHDRKFIVQDGTIVDMGADNMFGSSLLIDWCDAAIQTATTGVDGEVCVTVEKAKYIEEEIKPFRVKINRSNLTMNRQG